MCDFFQSSVESLEIFKNKIGNMKVYISVIMLYLFHFKILLLHVFFLILSYSRLIEPFHRPQCLKIYFFY